MTTLITEEELLKRGFERSEWLDRNKPTGTFDDRKYVHFEKRDTQAKNSYSELKMDVTFAYEAETDNDFKYSGVVFSLNIEGFYKEIPLNSFDDLCKLCDTVTSKPVAKKAK